MATVTVWKCDVSELPLDSKSRYRIDKNLSKRSSERLLVFVSNNPKQKNQEWIWADTQRSGGYTRRILEHTPGNQNINLCQRLQSISFGPKEQDLPAYEVIEKVRRNFDSEKVSNTFFQKFTSCRRNLAESIEGLEGGNDDGDKFWYSVLLLNRLMFIYFIQKKGFMGGDHDYLRTRLNKVKEIRGANQFFDFFYKKILIPLFHEYLGKGESISDDLEIKEIIGENIPYINGSIFTPHHLELNNEITIPDKAFEDIFELFDGYHWHLDSRAAGDPKEINPDILGHIFEQHINQKEKGAYYTSEDVTRYMCSRSIVPLFLERLQRAVGKSLSNELWKTLKENANEFIPGALFYGRDEPETKEGFATWDGGRKKRNDGSSFPDPLDPWLAEKNDKCSYRLPGETRREALERISWGKEIENKISAGKITDVNDCITLNLEMVKLALAWLASTDSEEVTLGAWEELRKIRILDPTVGSGAFLRAALDILEDLYEAVLNSVNRQIIKDRLQDKTRKELHALKNEVESHPSPVYFIRRTAIINNLYGNELQLEAVEICQLRLFLSLAAALDDPREIEPLPDLEFNIRSGNLLLGSENIPDAIERYGNDIFSGELVEELESYESQSAKLHSDFIRAQDNNKAREAEQLKEKIKALENPQREILDRLAANADGNESNNSLNDENQSIQQEMHKPFHWSIEFPEVMHDGGFDVVVGNPPFVAKANIDYRYSGFQTDQCTDIYAPCMERSVRLLKEDGRFAMISPISLAVGTRFEKLRIVLRNSLAVIWSMAFDKTPDRLFDAGVRPIITVGCKSSNRKNLYTTQLRRWVQKNRAQLFSTTRFSTSVSTERFFHIWVSIGHLSMYEFMHELEKRNKYIGQFISKVGKFKVGYRRITGMRYLSVFITEPPRWKIQNNTPGMRISGDSYCKWINFNSEFHRNAVFLFLAGKIGHIMWAMISDAFDVTTGVVTWKALDLDAFDVVTSELLNYATELNDLQIKNPSVDKNANLLVGNYDLGKCRHITDLSDKFILETLGLENFHPAILLADDWLVKSGDQGATTSYSWPKNWTPTEGPWSPGDPE